MLDLGNESKQPEEAEQIADRNKSKHFYDKRYKKLYAWVLKKF